MLWVFVALFALLAGYLVYIVDAYGSYWFASPYNTRVTAMESNVIAGDVTDSTGLVLATTGDDGERDYCSNRDVRLATGHVLGDDSSQTIGAESIFARLLLGFDDNIGNRLTSALAGEKRRGSDIALTINAELCAYANGLLDGHNGAIILMNYKTGAVIASTSSPEFDVSLMSGFADGSYVPEDGSLVNRATMGRYTPGSTFKIITTVAALRYLPNALDRTFTCTGYIAFDSATGALTSDYPFDGDGKVKDGYAVIRDYDNEVHGDLTLKEAFVHSCNNVFATIALEIGEDKLKKTAESLGLNMEFNFSELVAYCGAYKGAETDFQLAWSGAGQHTDIMTPVHMCLLSSAIANGGTAVEPKLLLGTVKDGKIYVSLKQESYKQFFKANEVEFLKECMRLTVAEGTGTRAAIDGFTVCGKTGTAEVSSNASVKPHAWFTGFIDDDEHPYAICVVVENAGTGGSVAAPIAAKLFRKAIQSE